MADSAGYFESPKNRAHWEKEMEGLRKVREERSAGGGSAPRKKEAAPSVTGELNPFRTRVTFAELEREEREASPAKAERVAKTTKVMERAAPVRSGPSA